MDPVVAELKQEIERLSRELDQASSEKVQSAKFGLLLLEEKKAVLQKCEELEGLYENAKNELDITQEVCGFRFRFQCHTLLMNLWNFQSTKAVNRSFHGSQRVETDSVLLFRYISPETV